VKFSVILALYGNSTFAIEQLNSILKQSHPVDEIVVLVDRGPKINEGVLDLLKSVKNLKFLYNINNLGPAVTFELAATFTTGNYVFFCDQDDIWFEHKVKFMKDYIEYNKADIIIHNALVLGSDGMFKHNSLVYNSPPKLLSSLIKNKVVGATMLVKQSVLKYVISNSGFYPMHDIVLIIAAVKKKYKVEFINEPLMSYRRHAETFTGRKRNLISKATTFIKFRLDYYKVWRKL
jgi:glycosyltransferase involved in cell wall biosynthesis